MKVVSGKQFCKLIESRGWQLKRINGSHYCREGRVLSIDRVRAEVLINQEQL